MPGRIIQGTENPKHSEKLNHVNKRKSKNELNNRGGGGNINWVCILGKV